MASDYPMGVTSPKTPPHTTSDYRYAPIPEPLIYDTTLSPLAVRVYAALMRHGTDPSSCYPSHERLAGLIGVAERSMQRPIKELESAGWLSRTTRRNERRERMSDGYHLYTAPRSSTRSTAQDNAVDHRVQPREPTALRNAVNETHEVHNESNQERNTASADADARAGALSLDLDASHNAPAPFVVDFEAWWSVWPDKRAKGAARTAYARAVRKTSAARLLEAAATFAADPNRDPQYTPHAATWLNQERWDDPPLTQRNSGRPSATDEKRTRSLSAIANFVNTPNTKEINA